MSIEHDIPHLAKISNYHDREWTGEIPNIGISVYFVMRQRMCKCADHLDSILLSTTCNSILRSNSVYSTIITVLHVTKFQCQASLHWCRKKFIKLCEACRVGITNAGKDMACGIVCGIVCKTLTTILLVV